MKYSYFPGCSLKGTGRAYEESLLPVFKALGVELEELDDWNCCGATAYMAVDEVKACVMASRNLAHRRKGRPPGAARPLQRLLPGPEQDQALPPRIARGRGGRAEGAAPGEPHLQRQHAGAPSPRRAGQQRGDRRDQEARQAAAQGTQGRAVLRLPDRAALRDLRRPVQSHDAWTGSSRPLAAPWSPTRSRPAAAAAA